MTGLPDSDSNKDTKKSFAQCHGKRLGIHALGMLAGMIATLLLPAEMATPSRQAALFLCAYAGTLNLIPREFTFSATYTIPLLSGVGPAAGFIFSGEPWQLTPLWAGLSALICRMICQRKQLSDVATVLPITLLALVSFGLDLSALSKIAFPFWFAIFGLSAWLGCRSLRSLEKYRALADNPVLKDKAKRQRIMNYTDTIRKLEAKRTETSLEMHPYIGAISDSARAIIDRMVIEPRHFSEGDLFLARYLAPALRLIEEHTALQADYAGQKPDAANHPLTRSRDILERLERAFKDQLVGMRTSKRLDFQADLTVLDKLLKMDGR